MNHVIAVGSVLIYSGVVFLLIRSVSRIRIPLLLLCMVLGVLSAMISIGLEYAWNYYLNSFIRSHYSLVFIESFIGVALIEEASKWIWLVFVISRWPSFNSHADGILCACGIAAGFNMVESNLYASIESNPINMVIRSVTAIPVHFLFGIVMGFLFARHKFGERGSFWFSLLIPVILHGLYDFFILQPYAELLMGMAVFVLIGCLSLSIWICRLAVKLDRLRLAVEASE